MLFSSYAFIFLFLPAFLILYRSCPVYVRGGLLLGFSILFYLCWSFPFLWLLLGLSVFNYWLGCRLDRQTAGSRSRRGWLILGLIINLLPLIWFKYSFFIIENLALFFHKDWLFTPPGLPPGISFYTFIQIAWLTGIYQNLFRPPRLMDHALFSCFFPYVLSGPIVRYPQIGDELERPGSLAAASLARGITLFGLGLAKKAILADSLAIYADSVFAAAQKGWPLSCPDAWLGSLCYTFQLYFDFSGYTDMALGIGMMIGLKLPENFNSPYRATGIVEFWRRWHITLGTWLRDFIYIPLGGNRKGRLRQCLNLFLTMLIGGFWHGAGWTYIIWGAAHGLMLAVNHWWRMFATHRPRPGASQPLTRFCSTAFTFLLLNLCWILFRSPSLNCATAMYEAMFDPTRHATQYFPHWLPYALLTACGIICWTLPNSQQIISGSGHLLKWQPGKKWAYGMGVAGAISLLLLSRKTTFLYFQF